MTDSQPHVRNEETAAPVWRVVLAAGVMGLIALQQLPMDTGSSLLGETVINALHIPLFAALCVLLAMLGLRPWQLLAASAALAGVTEGAQMLTGRSASLLDLGLDLLGALPVIVAVAVTRRTAPGDRGRHLAWAATAVLIASMTLAAPVRVLLAYHERDQRFPVLFAPGAWATAPLVTTGDWARVVPAPARGREQPGRPMLEVVWPDRQYPGITLSEVVPDWQAFETLTVDVYLPDGPAMPLTAAVGHAGTEGTAAYLQRLVQPGAQRIEYGLRRLLATPDGATPRITRLVLHTNHNHAGRRLLIGAVRLKGDGRTTR